MAVMIGTLATRVVLLMMCLLCQLGGEGTIVDILARQAALPNSRQRQQEVASGQALSFTPSNKHHKDLILLRSRPIQEARQMVTTKRSKKKGSTSHARLVVSPICQAAQRRITRHYKLPR